MLDFGKVGRIDQDLRDVIDDLVVAALSRDVASPVDGLIRVCDPPAMLDWAALRRGHGRLDRSRSSVEIGIDYVVDPDHASEILERAVAEVDGVRSDPLPVVPARGFGDGTTILQVRWWHDPDISSQTRTLDRVVRTIKHAVDGAGINMPSPEIIITRHTAEGT